MKISLTVTEIWPENVWKNSLRGITLTKKGKSFFYVTCGPDLNTSL